MNKLISTIVSKSRTLAAAISRAFGTSAAAAPLPLGPASTPYTNAVLMHLCSGNRDVALHVLRWIAEPLRRPGTKMTTALMVNGGQGIGKSLFFADLIAPMHDRYVQVRGAELNSTFNNWALNTLFAVVDECDSNTVNRTSVKALLTSSKLMIKRKNEEPVIQCNRMNFVFLCGSIDALAPDTGDRRFFVIDGPSTPLPSEFYVGMREEINQGARQAYLQFLIEQLDTDNRARAA